LRIGSSGEEGIPAGSGFNAWSGKGGTRLRNFAEVR
jgi:hypothetical protein